VPDGRVRAGAPMKSALMSAGIRADGGGETRKGASEMLDMLLVAVAMVGTLGLALVVATWDFGPPSATSEVAWKLEALEGYLDELEGQREAQAPGLVLELGRQRSRAA